MSDFLDDIVYKIVLEECEKESIAEVSVLAHVKGYFGVEKRYAETIDIATIQYVECNYRNTHHQLKILNIMPYLTTVGKCAEDIDFRIQANLMYLADAWEQFEVHVTMERRGKKLYETGQQSGVLNKQEILQEAANREIQLPDECNFAVTE